MKRSNRMPFGVDTATDRNWAKADGRTTRKLSTHSCLVDDRTASSNRTWPVCTSVSTPISAPVRGWKLCGGQHEVREKESIESGRRDRDKTPVYGRRMKEYSYTRLVRDAVVHELRAETNVTRRVLRKRAAAANGTITDTRGRTHARTHARTHRDVRNTWKRASREDKPPPPRALHGRRRSRHTSYVFARHSQQSGNVPRSSRSPQHSLFPPLSLLVTTVKM